MKRRAVLSTILLVWLVSCPCAAQERGDAQTSVPQLVPKVLLKDDGAEQAKDAKTTAPSFPGLAEVVPRATETGQKAIEAEKGIAAIRDVSDFEKRLAGIQNRVAQIAKKIDGMGDPTNWNIYRLLDVQRLIQLERDQLTVLLESISSRLSELEAVRKHWEEENTLWKKWEGSLRGSQTEIPLESFKKVRETAGAVLQSASSASPSLLALQQKLTGQLEEVRQLSVPIDTALQKVRSELVKRNSPSFFSREFLGQFDAKLWTALWAGLTKGWKMDSDEFHSAAWILFLNILAILSLTFLIRHRRWLPEKTSEWHFIGEHAWAFSIFVTQGLTALFHQSPAPSWIFFTFAMVILSATFLISDMLPHRRVRRVLFVLAGVQIVSAVLKLTSVPPPVYNLYLAGISLAGIWFFLSQAARHMAEHDGRLDAISAGSRGAALVALAVLIALMAGYSNLADYVIRSSVGTIFLVVVGLLVLHLGNGCIEVALNHPAVTRIGFFSRFGAAFESRLKNLLKAVLWIGVFLALFQMWGIYTSLGQAWEKIFQFKFAIGELTVSLGRILLAVLFLYLILSASWFVRAFLDGEVFPRQQLDRGARDAIKKMAHYSFLFLGVLMAVSVMGLNLTSFAFLTGAVGIGVGFGLQNIVNNFVSGLMLLFERPFKVGDVVVVDNETGTVRKIGLRSTIIETADRSEIIVPNSQFISGKVVNWTRTSHIARVRVAVGVAYGSDVAQVLQLLKGAAEGDPRILNDPAPNPVFFRFGDSSLEFELHCWIADVKQSLAVKSDLCQEIDRRFRDAGVEMPFPQRDLHLRSVHEDILKQAMGTKKNIEQE